MSLPVEKSVGDLVFVLNGLRSDYLIVGNELGNIVLLDPETKEYVGFVNVRTTEINIYNGET